MFTLIVGIPNSGKTTYSQRYDNVFHADELGMKETEYIIKTEKDLCVEGIFVLSKHRKKLCDLYNGKKVCVWMDTPLEECKKRENRGRGLWMTEQWASIFEPPTYEEGWDEIICQK